MADLAPLSYVAGTAASITAVLGGARAYYRSQRKRFMAEGAQRERNAKALEANTKAAEENTEAIGRLAEKLEAFADETRRELAAHGGRIEANQRRIGHLEDLAGSGRWPRKEQP